MKLLYNIIGKNFFKEIEMSKKYISREKENIVKRSLKGVGYWLMGSFMCLFMCSMLLVLMKSILILKIFVAFCTTVIMLGLFFNWAYNAAKRDKNAVKFHNMEFDKYMPLKMSIAAPIVSYVMLVLLYMCKLGALPESFFSAYLICDMWILPYITMFTEERTIGSVSWVGMGGLTLLTLLQPAAISLTYILTYNDVDVINVIFYKKDKKL